MKDRKRHDMQDDKERLYTALTGPILRCCFDANALIIANYIILIILPFAILHIMFFLEVVKHIAL